MDFVFDILLPPYLAQINLEKAESAYYLYRNWSKSGLPQKKPENEVNFFSLKKDSIYPCIWMLFVLLQHCGGIHFLCKNKHLMIR